MSVSEPVVAPELETARRVWESSPDHTPADTAALVAGARAILRSPQPWSDADREILRFVDSAYGGRVHWLIGTQTWADRIQATPDDLTRIAELEGAVAAAKHARQERFSDYVELLRESHRRKVAVDKAITRALSRESGRFEPPPGTSLEELQKLDIETKAAERRYAAALDTEGDALGALNAFKLGVQQRYLASPQAWEPVYLADGTRIR
jgi:hypothetical protein